MDLNNVRKTIDDITASIDEFENQVFEINRMRASIRKNKTMAAKAALESNNKKQRLSVSVRIQSRSKRMADLMKITSTMLKQISQNKYSWPFMKPVDVEGLELHDYHDIIKEPMDLGTIKDKLDGKLTTSYSNPREICEDVRLTFNNAMTYNKAGHDVHFMAEQLLKKWEEKWQQNMEPRLIEEAAKQQQEDEEDKEEREAIAAQEAEEAAVENLAKELMDKLDESSGKLQGLVHYAAENCRPMTFEEKRRLGQNIGKMPPENVNHIIQIVKEMNGAGEGGSEDDLEFDVDAQEPLTLWRLENYMQFVLDSLLSPTQKLNANKRPKI